MATYDLPTAKGKVSEHATGKYGRAPREDEWSTIGAGIDLNNLDGSKTQR